MNNIKMIAAVSSNGVIGKNNSLPFHYTADMKHFRKMTANSTVIMGKNTFQSMGSKPLPGRRNIIVSTTLDLVKGIEIFPTTPTAIYAANYPYGESLVAPCYTYAEDKWFIGGASIYADGMSVADEIYLTITPDIIEGKDLVRFPWINPQIFSVASTEKFPDDDRLTLVRYVRQ
jgi:dihydrofolate reductase